MQNDKRKINTYLLEFNEDKTILRNDRLDEIINKIFDYFKMSIYFKKIIKFIESKIIISDENSL